MNDFLEYYDSLCETYPLYMKIEHLRKGIMRWRLCVYGKSMAKIDSDALIICREAPTREEMFNASLEALKKREPELATLPQQIDLLSKYLARGTGK